MMNKELKTRAGISKITLSNFQVFADKTEIPIDKITLLFGPNSAGKSAIEDALDIVSFIKGSEIMQGSRAVSEAFSTTGFAGRSIVGGMSRENSEFLKKILSCWRKSSHPAKYEQSMSIEIEENLSLDDGEGLYILANQKSTQAQKISETFVFYIQDEDFDGTLDQPDDIKILYILSIDQVCLLSFTEGYESASINCQHKSISPLDFSSYFNHEMDIGSVDEIHASKDFDVNLKSNIIASFDNEIINFDGVFGFTLRGHSEIQGIRKSMMGSRLVQLAKNKQEYENAFVIFSTIFQEILESVWKWRNEALSLQTVIVNASRKIPTTNDLFIYTKHSLESKFLVESQLHGFTHHPCFFDGKKINSPISSKNNYIHYLHDADIHSRVNYFLSNQMFSEKGYFIGKDVEYIPYNNVDPVKNVELRLTFTQFFLADPDATRFSFEEVGSGLGYVFPILCVCSQSARNLVIIQQPELHLHPALQASLGDVFIESAESKTLIVESHSEHLLLRILKRIRQSHLQANIAAELKINADDVCVLYFDPSPDGTTTVKRLRITEDGEFMDRWPRGFFGERDQELLDE